MGQAAQAGALLWHRGCAVGVDLDHEALREPLVAVIVAAIGAGTHDAGVEARVLVVGARGFPAVAAVGSGRGRDRAAVASEGRVQFGCPQRLVAGRAEVVAAPVLFGRQQCAPGRRAIAAVVHGAARLRAVGRKPGDEKRIAARRARELKLGGAGDAAVESRTLNIGELGVGALGHLDHADAVAGHFDVGLGSRTRARRRAVDVQEDLVDVFVVHCQQAAAAAGDIARACGVEAEILDAVVVVATALVVVGVGAVVLEGSYAGRQRVTQGEQRACGVAGGHGALVGQRLCDGREAQDGGWRRGGRGCGGDGRDDDVIVATATGR